MKNNIITLAHGSGGKLMHELIQRLRIKFSNRALDEAADAAEIVVPGRRLAFSTDSFVVKPLFFPGGDIGSLAVFGTVNDISMKGAKPLFVSLAFIIEEGLEFTVLERISDSIKKAASTSGVKVVTGDVKVVEKSAADGMFINTAGIGVIGRTGTKIGAKAAPGDAVIINGGIAEHGMAVLNARENLGFKPAVRSDCRNLNIEVRRCLRASGNISALRDPTRGGLATALCEIAVSSGLGIDIREESVPVKRNVRRVCDILGFDPMYVANEGKFICFVREKDAGRVARAMGPEARVIGRVTRKHRKEVWLRTLAGGERVLAMLQSDQLPRIC